jgi:hypothetical protein
MAVAMDEQLFKKIAELSKKWKNQTVAKILDIEVSRVEYVVWKIKNRPNISYRPTGRPANPIKLNRDQIKRVKELAQFGDISKKEIAQDMGIEVREVEKVLRHQL